MKDMKYGKDMKSSKSGGSLTSVKGMYSYSKNPMPAASQNKAMCGPGMNSDQSKANRMLQKAQSEVDSLRGKSGM